MHLFLIFLTSITLAYATVDTDGDGLLDHEEDKNGNMQWDSGETNLFDADTDDGGEADGREVQAGRNPLDRTDDVTFDIDGDGLTNGQEEELGTDPTIADSDNDGTNDGDDPFALDARYSQDNDNDGIADEYEALHGLSSSNADDALEDPDNDGLINADEFIYESDLFDADSDNDGMLDGREVEVGSDPLENPCLQYGGVGTPYSDIESHWAYSYIHHTNLLQALPTGAKLIEGVTFPDREEFQPNTPITRYDLLRMILLGSCIPLLEDTETVGVLFRDFSPVARPRESNERKLKRQIIYTAVGLGIIEGYDDRTFRADAPVNRAEAMKILLKASKLEPLTEPFAIRSFTDVPPDAWFAPYVMQMVEYAIIDGYGDDTFRPGNNITRAEATKVVLLIVMSNPHVNGYVIPTEDSEDA